MASAPDDDPPMSVIIDATLAHLVQSETSIHQARDKLDLVTIQQFNTDVIGLWYRTRVDS